MSSVRLLELKSKLDVRQAALADDAEDLIQTRGSKPMMLRSLSIPSAEYRDRGFSFRRDNHPRQLSFLIDSAGPPSKANTGRVA